MDANITNVNGNYLPLLTIPNFWGWTSYTPVIPKLYWDVYSQEERIKRICMDFDKMTHYSSMLAEEINKTNDNLSDLSVYVKGDEFKAQIEAAVDKWVDENLTVIFTRLAKQVFFGLTTDGRFVAYIPEGWDDITFDTGQTFKDDDYGRLILRWDTTGTSPVDQTRSQEVLQNGIDD